MNATQLAVKELIKQLTGQSQILTIPRPFVAFTGDHVCALMLSQIIYWSERTHDPEGWFYKTLEGWAEELCLTPFQVRRAARELKKYGVESKLRKRSRLEGPKLHYRINDELFTETFTEFLNGGVTALPDPNVKKLNNKETAPLKGEETSLLNNEETSLSSIKDSKITRTKSTQRLHTHTARASAAPPPAGAGVSVSKNSLTEEDYYEYARTSPGFKYPDAWAATHWEKRDRDKVVRDWKLCRSPEAVEAARSEPPDNNLKIGEARAHVRSVLGVGAYTNVSELIASLKVSDADRERLRAEFVEPAAGRAQSAV